MPGFLDEKPEPFLRGRPQPGARDLNTIVQAVLRRLYGGRDTEVGYYGDRVTIGSNGLVAGLPDILNYVAPFTVVQELDDLLLCIPFSLPVAGTPPLWTNPVWSSPFVGNSTPLIYVAKPFDLQKSPWNGKSLIVNGVATTYIYTGIGQRNANMTAQQITPNYFAGDVILAVRAPTGLLTPPTQNQAPQQYVIWQDINNSARIWAGSSAASVFSGCRVSSQGHTLTDSTPVSNVSWSVSSTPADFNFDTGYIGSGGGVFVPSTGYYHIIMSGMLTSLSTPGSTGHFDELLYINGNYANTEDVVHTAQTPALTWITLVDVIFPLTAGQSINGVWKTAATGISFTLNCVLQVEKVG